MQERPLPAVVPSSEPVAPRPAKLRFIDLFAGLGGFHLALAHLGHECVFASELDPQLRVLYRANFDMPAAGDIKQVSPANIPPHDVLCAGFPCQPYSKAGEQAGLDDPKWGDLFSYILRILHYHQPRFLILENVPNLERHDKGRTWDKVRGDLELAGYDVDHKKLSPHRFGVPQIRERIFIVGSRRGLDSFRWPDETHTRSTGRKTSIREILEESPSDARKLPDQVLRCIAMWQEFLDIFPADEQLPSFPIWSMEFGADYPYEHTTPFALGAERLRVYKGAHGVPLAELDKAAMLSALPSYARASQAHFPSWKIDFIRKNRALYERHKGWIDGWRSKVLEFPPSLQKLEWNAKGEPRDLHRLVLQIRPSGVRVKRDETAPSLVAMTTTQVPIITWEQRYMTPRECARLQSMDALRLPDSATAAYAALGNAVNVRLVRLIAERLLVQPTHLSDIFLRRQLEFSLPGSGWRPVRQGTAGR